MLRRIAFGAVLCLLAASAFAQEFRGTITGRVTDSQNAAVPLAKITATLVSTSSRSTTTTSTDGLYTIPFLAPGTYRIEAEAPGSDAEMRPGGLGLEIAWRFAAASGGSISLTPREGGGTCAWVDLPVAPTQIGGAVARVADPGR